MPYTWSNISIHSQVPEVSEGVAHMHSQSWIPRAQLKEQQNQAPGYTNGTSAGTVYLPLCTYLSLLLRLWASPGNTLQSFTSSQNSKAWHSAGTQ